MADTKPGKCNVKLSKDFFGQLVITAQRSDIGRFVVAAVVRTKNNEILIVKRSMQESFLPGLEELPGGHVEEGEALEQALRRELQEETGLAVNEIISLIDYFDYRCGNGRITRQWNFLVETQLGPVRLNPLEHQSFRWLASHELDDAKVSELTRRSLQACWS